MLFELYTYLTVKDPVRGHLIDKPTYQNLPQVDEWLDSLL